jgi:hypothetical protein
MVSVFSETMRIVIPASDCNEPSLKFCSSTLAANVGSVPSKMTEPVNSFKPVTSDGEIEAAAARLVRIASRSTASADVWSSIHKRFGVRSTVGALVGETVVAGSTTTVSGADRTGASVFVGKTVVITDVVGAFVNGEGVAGLLRNVDGEEVANGGSMLPNGGTVMIRGGGSGDAGSIVRLGEGTGDVGDTEGLPVGTADGACVRAGEGA